MLLGARLIHGSVEGRKCGIDYRHFIEVTAGKLVQVQYSSQLAIIQLKTNLIGSLAMFAAKEIASQLVANVRTI